MAGSMLGCSGEFRQGDRAINRKAKGILPRKGRVRGVLAAPGRVSLGLGIGRGERGNRLQAEKG